MPVERTPIRYARSGDVQVAYQVTGAGPLDVVIAGWDPMRIQTWWPS